MLRGVFFCLFNELVDDVSVGVQERDYVVDVVFSNERFVSTFIEDLRFDFSHENVCKSYHFFDDHGGSAHLQVILLVELEWVPFKCFLQWGLRKEEGISVKILVRCAFYEYALNLWYVCVYARNMRRNEYHFFRKLVICIFEIWPLLLCDRLKSLTASLLGPPVGGVLLSRLNMP